MEESKNSKINIKQQPSNNSNKFLIIILTSISLFSIATATYAVYQNIKLRKQIKQLLINSNQSESTNQSSPSPTPTKDWKTYLNESLGFSFLYPSEWVEKETISNGDEVFAYIYPNKQTELTNQHYLQLSKYNKLPNYEYIPTFANHHRAYRVKTELSSERKLAYFIKKSNGTYISISLFPSNTRDFYNQQFKYVKTLEQILSTFQFTDPEEEVTMRGVLKKLENPVPDVNYHYRVHLYEPFYDELNAMDLGYIYSLIVVPENPTIKRQLENNIGNQIEIIGKIEWGLAETRHLKALKVN